MYLIYLIIFWLVKAREFHGSRKKYFGGRCGRSIASPSQPPSKKVVRGLCMGRGAHILPTAPPTVRVRYATVLYMDIFTHRNLNGHG